MLSGLSLRLHLIRMRISSFNFSGLRMCDMYTYMCVYTHICVCVYLHTCVSVYEHMHTQMYTLMYVYVYI
jgi:hypothetical protein